MHLGTIDLIVSRHIKFRRRHDCLFLVATLFVSRILITLRINEQYWWTSSVVTKITVMVCVVGRGNESKHHKKFFLFRTVVGLSSVGSESLE